MSIGEFSQRSGLSLKRLRTYAANGLLVPAAIDAGSGYRYYSPGQLRDAHLIDTLRQTAMPLGDIEALLRHRSTDQLDAWARSVEEETAQRHGAFERARHLLTMGTQSPPSSDYQRSGAHTMTQLRTASRTETGLVREENEDAVISNDHVVAMADGMGGHPGGEVASAMAVSLIDAAFTGQSAYELEAAVRAANRAIFDRASAISGLEGMGTTICAAGLLNDGRVALVNVGDTRAYLLHGRSGRQLTHDHTLTADLVQRGELSEEEARRHPHRGILMRALGVGPDVELDSATLSMETGDRLLLCTDGLFNELRDEEIVTSRTERNDAHATVDELIAAALARGGHDNISVMVVEVVEV